MEERWWSLLCRHVGAEQHAVSSCSRLSLKILITPSAALIPAAIKAAAELRSPQRLQKEREAALCFAPTHQLRPSRQPPLASTSTSTSTASSGERRPWLLVSSSRPLTPGSLFILLPVPADMNAAAEGAKAAPPKFKQKESRQFKSKAPKAGQKG